jgi:hypothetical protein
MFMVLTEGYSWYFYFPSVFLRMLLILLENAGLNQSVDTQGETASVYTLH